MQNSFCEHMLSFLLGKYLGVKLLAHRVDISFLS